ncbi:LytTR family DNA-binding domain-containing protein [Blautia schinkii]|nr:LytTR family DNA-binding domain-containing protein [Blautia schinkii]
MLAVICEDISEDYEILKDYCVRYEKENSMQITVMHFKNAGMLLKSKEARMADVMFLDIYMEGASGVDAARILRAKGFCGAFIFTTTSREHYAEGFDVAALHYLVKPITWDAFCVAMSRVLKKPQPSRKSLQVTSGFTELEVDVTGILYIEVYGHKTIIHTVKGELTVRQPLAALEAALGGEPFIRCYRCFIVNMDYVQRINEDSFLMKDDREIPLSRDKRALLRSIYLSYVFKHMEE